ncbi:MAG: hypothetical protein M1833_003488 [Piccolia ochrophora]|nr:MAG: hypothetical protein M1833_003488 [Piccolia ochrophora]
MNDPSSGVPPVLLPHVHLLSNFQFPVMAHLPVDTIVKYLTQAPDITRHTTPMMWQFTDAPRDGTILLEWQAPQLGNHFASDGYVWADAEQAYTMDAKGYTVEMYIHRTGFHPPHETHASHQRRRYHLTSSSLPNSSALVDPSLWLVHYSASDANLRVPVQQIPIPPPLQQVLNTRRWLQSQGQLVRKEFMLHDRSNWPTLNLPPKSMLPQYPLHGPATSGPQPSRGMQQAPFYPQQHVAGAVGPSPSKRQRQMPHSQLQGPNSGVPSNAMVQHDPSLEEDEDASNGDFFDHITPRQISMMRYKQHHEWLEEIVSSPYSMSQILPLDLGLGLKGDLEEITGNFFKTPTSEPSDVGKSSQVIGKMEPGKAEEFTKRAEAYIEKTRAETEVTESQHSKTMEDWAKKSVFDDGEKRLIDAVSDPSDTGTEIWRIEGRLDTDGEGEDVKAATTVRKVPESIDQVVVDVEAVVGRKPTFAPNDKKTLVQEGGLERKLAGTGRGSQNQSELNGSVDGNTGDGDADMGNGGFLDQFGLSTASTPGAHLATPLSQASSQGPSVNGTPAAATATTSHHTPTQVSPPEASETRVQTPGIHQDGGGDVSQGQQQSNAAVPQPSDMDVDSEMAGMFDESGHAPSETAPAGEVSDWVMVESEDNKADIPTQSVAAAPAPAGQDIQQVIPAKVNTPDVYSETVGATLPGLTPPPGVHDSVTEVQLDGNDFSDFANLDTAGDALADFDGVGGNLSLDDHGGLDLDNSAFGDAFHGTDVHDESAP